MRALIAAIATAMIASACASLAPPAGDRSTRLYTLDCGRILITRPSAFDTEDRLGPEPRELVVPCYLIRHPRGDLLWDAGLSDAIAEMDGGRLEGRVGVSFVTVTLAAQLQELGVPPSAVEYLAMSHSHYDHAGNAH
ncbi:MAG: MBL fold metallo-hydrolase, partial [Caulobacterales bacterium]|nr:MBL fold metallo-hydrolase [Caulobacterales bacterium]